MKLNNKTKTTTTNLWEKPIGIYTTRTIGDTNIGGGTYTEEDAPTKI